MFSHTKDLLLLKKIFLPRKKKPNRKKSQHSVVLCYRTSEHLLCVFRLAMITKDMLKKTATEITEADLIGPLVQE